MGQQDTREKAAFGGRIRKIRRRIDYTELLDTAATFKAFHIHTFPAGGEGNPLRAFGVRINHEVGPEAPAFVGLTSPVLDVGTGAQEGTFIAAQAISAGDADDSLPWPPAVSNLAGVELWATISAVNNVDQATNGYVELEFLYFDAGTVEVENGNGPGA